VGIAALAAALPYGYPFTPRILVLPLAAPVPPGTGDVRTLLKASVPSASASLLSEVLDALAQPSLSPQTSPPPPRALLILGAEGTVDSPPLSVQPASLSPLAAPSGAGDRSKAPPADPYAERETSPKTVAALTADGLLRVVAETVRGALLGAGAALTKAQLTTPLGTLGLDSLGLHARSVKEEECFDWSLPDDGIPEPPQFIVEAPRPNKAQGDCLTYAYGQVQYCFEEIPTNFPMLN